MFRSPIRAAVIEAINKKIEMGETLYKEGMKVIKDTFLSEVKQAEYKKTKDEESLVSTLVNSIIK